MNSNVTDTALRLGIGSCCRWLAVLLHCNSSPCCLEMTAHPNHTRRTNNPRIQITVTPSPITRPAFFYLRQRRRYMFSPVRPRSFVCVQDYSKTRAWIWMICCVSTDVGTWTNWLTFEPDPDHSPDAGTGFLSPIAYALQRGNVELYYVGKIPCTYWYWGPVEAATRGFEASKDRCRR